MNYLLYIILFILTLLFVKISCEFRLYYVITKQNFIIKMLLFAAVIVIVIRSYMENNNVEGFDENTGYYNRQGEINSTTRADFIKKMNEVLKLEYEYKKHQEYDNYNHTKLKLSDIQEVTNQGSGSLNDIVGGREVTQKIHNENGGKYAEISFQKENSWDRINPNSIKIIKSGTGFRPGITYNVGKYFRFTIPDSVCSNPQHTTREDCLKKSGKCVDLDDNVDTTKTQDECVPSGCVLKTDNTTLHVSQQTQVECVDDAYIWSSNTTGNTWIPSNTWDIEIKSMATPSTETSNIKKEENGVETGTLVDAQKTLKDKYDIDRSNPTNITDTNQILSKTNIGNAMQEAFWNKINSNNYLLGPPSNSNQEPVGTIYTGNDDNFKATFDSTKMNELLEQAKTAAKIAGEQAITKHNESLKETGANKGLFTGDVGMNFNPAYNDSGELSTIYGGEVQQESGSQENISPINLDTYSKDILETIYPPSCTKTINQREKICATLDTHNKCNSSTCCAYNSYNGQNMCVAGDRNGPSTIKSLIDYYYYLGKCYPGKKSCPNKPPL